MKSNSNVQVGPFLLGQAGLICKFPGQHGRILGKAKNHFLKNHLRPPKPRWWRRALWRVTFRLSSCTEWKSRSFDWSQCFDCRKTYLWWIYEIEQVISRWSGLSERDRSQEIWGVPIFLFRWLKEESNGPWVFENSWASFCSCPFPNSLNLCITEPGRVDIFRP